MIVRCIYFVCDICGRKSDTMSKGTPYPFTWMKRDGKDVCPFCKKSMNLTKNK